MYVEPHTPSCFRRNSILQYYVEKITNINVQTYLYLLGLQKVASVGSERAMRPKHKTPPEVWVAAIATLFQQGSNAVATCVAMFISVCETPIQPSPSSSRHFRSLLCCRKGGLTGSFLATEELGTYICKMSRTTIDFPQVVCLIAASLD